MQFIPLSENELQMASLLPEGSYRYSVYKAEDKLSHAGNEYTAITLKVWDNEGKEHLVFTNMSLIKLLKHFCDVNGMFDQYNSGNISAHEFVDKNEGRVLLGVEGEKPDGKGGMYKAKNIVKDYIGSAQASLTAPLMSPSKGQDFVDDKDIPF